MADERQGAGDRPREIWTIIESGTMLGYDGGLAGRVWIESPDGERHRALTVSAADLPSFPAGSAFPMPPPG